MTWLNINRRSCLFQFVRRAWFIPLVCCLLSCGSSKDSGRRVSIADESYFQNRSIFNNYTLSDTLFALIPSSAFDVEALNVCPRTDVPISAKPSKSQLVKGVRTMVPISVRHARLGYQGTDSLKGGAAGRAILVNKAVPDKQHSYFIWFIVALAVGCVFGLFICVLVFRKIGR